MWDKEKVKTCLEKFSQRRRHTEQRWMKKKWKRVLKHFFYLIQKKLWKPVYWMNFFNYEMYMEKSFLNDVDIQNNGGWRKSDNVFFYLSQRKLWKPVYWTNFFNYEMYWKKFSQQCQHTEQRWMKEKWKCVFFI